jgi:hypothetical protein
MRSITPRHGRPHVSDTEETEFFWHDLRNGKMIRHLESAMSGGLHNGRMALR